MAEFNLQLAFRSIPIEKDKLDEWAFNILKELKDNCYKELQVDELIYLVIGLISSNKMGLTPHHSQMAQLSTFCKTNGRLQELFSNLFNYFDPMSLASESFFYKSLIFDKSIKLNILEKLLRKDGYLVWPRTLPSELVDQILRFPILYPNASVLKINDERISLNCSSPLQFLNGNCIKITYRIKNDDQTLNLISSDPVLLFFIRRYLGARAILRHAFLDYSFPSIYNTASSEAAQLYHFDLDTFQWLKIFIYLNPVNEQNGPHSALLGSHIPGSKSPELLERGYSRISDNDLIARSKYPPTTFTAHTGTIIIGDTKAFHKGTAVINNYRSMLTLFYSSSLFGLNMGD